MSRRPLLPGMPIFQQLRRRIRLITDRHQGAARRNPSSSAADRLYPVPRRPVFNSPSINTLVRDVEAMREYSSETVAPHRRQFVFGIATGRADSVLKLITRPMHPQPRCCSLPALEQRSDYQPSVGGQSPGTPTAPRLDVPMCFAARSGGIPA